MYYEFCVVGLAEERSEEERRVHLLAEQGGTRQTPRKVLPGDPIAGGLSGSVSLSLGTLGGSDRGAVVAVEAFQDLEVRGVGCHDRIASVLARCVRDLT